MGEINMDENKYIRQKDINLNIPTAATIVGIGGVGSWVAYQLALIGVQELTLIDMDNVEEHNMNRSPFKQSDIGLNKAQAISAHLTNLRPNIQINIITSTWEDVGELFGDVVLDCCDNLKTQKAICKKAKELDMKYMKAGYEGLRIMVTDQVSGWRNIAEDARGYDIPPTPSFAVSSNIVASLAVLAIIDNEQHTHDLTFDIRDILDLKIVRTDTNVEKE